MNHINASPIIAIPDPKYSLTQGGMDMKLGSERLLTLKEAEAMTGRKVATWRKDILCRRIAVVKLGRSVRIPIEAIEDLIREGYRSPTSGTHI